MVGFEKATDLTMQPDMRVLLAKDLRCDMTR